MAAVFQLADVLWREADRRNEGRRSEDRFAPQRANTGLVHHGITLACVGGATFTRSGLAHLAAFEVVRVMNARNGLEQALAIGGRQCVRDVGVPGDLFKQHGGGAQPRQQILIWLWRYGAGIVYPRSVGHCFGIWFERRLCEEVPMEVTWRRAHQQSATAAPSAVMDE